MTKVFIGGSRHVTRLDAKVRARLDNIIERGFPILIGDATGVDKAVQHYLYSRRYRNAEVFCSNGVCRNNLGGWQTRPIAAARHARGREFYLAKDRAMAEEATVGLMIWDGKSVGTVLNLFRLLSLHKPAVVYTVPEASFQELRSGKDWDNFLSGCDTGLRHELKRLATWENSRASVQALALD